MNEHVENYPEEKAGLGSIWMSVIGIILRRLDYLWDEVEVYASSRRFWLTLVSAFGLFWLVVDGGYTVYAISSEMGSVLGMVDGFIIMLMTSVIPFLMGCVLSHQYLKGDVIEHNHTIMIVFAARLVIFAVIVLIQMIVYIDQFDLHETAGLAGVVKLLHFDVMQIFSISGMRILLDLSIPVPELANPELGQILWLLSMIALFVAAYFYWLLYQGLRLVHGEKKPSDLLIAIIIIALCVEILPITVYGLIG